MAKCNIIFVRQAKFDLWISFRARNISLIMVLLYFPSSILCNKSIGAKQIYMMRDSNINAKTKGALTEPDSAREVTLLICLNEKSADLCYVQAPYVDSRCNTYGQTLVPLPSDNFLMS